MEAEKKAYSAPRITEVRLEDKRVVAMSACKQSEPVPPERIQNGFVLDIDGNPIMAYDAS